MSTVKVEKPDFLHLRWSEADDNILREMVAGGFTGTEIAQALGRTRSSILTRKFTLGIKSQIRRSLKGTASPLTYGTKSFYQETKGLTKGKNVIREMLDVLSEEIPSDEVKSVQEKAKGKTKKPVFKPETSDEKLDRGRLCQSAKLVSINRRLRRGDVTVVAEKTGFTVGFVSSVLAGTFPNEKIVNYAFNRFRGRKENQSYLQDNRSAKPRKRKQKEVTK